MRCCLNELSHLIVVLIRVTITSNFDTYNNMTTSNSDTTNVTRDLFLSDITYHVYEPDPLMEECSRFIDEKKNEYAIKSDQAYEARVAAELEISEKFSNLSAHFARQQQLEFCGQEDHSPLYGLMRDIKMALQRREDALQEEEIMQKLFEAYTQIELVAYSVKQCMYRPYP